MWNLKETHLQYNNLQKGKLLFFMPVGPVLAATGSSELLSKYKLEKPCWRLSEINKCQALKVG